MQETLGRRGRLGGGTWNSIYPGRVSPAYPTLEVVRETLRAVTSLLGTESFVPPLPYFVKRSAVGVGLPTLLAWVDYASSNSQL